MKKTLELNITHEFLEICQSYDSRVFALEITLIQEHNLGYDSRILGRLPDFWRISVFQYKPEIIFNSI